MSKEILQNLIPRSPKAAALVGAVIVALVAGASALLAQQGDKPPPPTPNATQLAQLAQIIEYNEERDITPQPPFEGELNGFTFGASGGAPCDGGTRNMPSPQGSYVASELSEFDSSLLTSSPLNFDVSYVPSGFIPQLLESESTGASGSVVASGCANQSGSISIDSVLVTWQSPSAESNDPTARSAAHFRIERSLASQPRIPAIFSKEQLEVITINGRPSIVVNPRFTGEHVFVYMRDDHSQWTIDSWDLSTDELLKIAQGLR